MLTGKYIFKLDGKVIAEKTNVITASGLDAINQYLVGTIPSWAGTIALGSLYTVSASTDTKLAYEVTRSPVILRSYDRSSRKITVKATMDPMFVGSIYEIGVYPQNFYDANVKDNLFISNFNEQFGTSTVSSTWYTGPNASTLWNANALFVPSASSRIGNYGIAVNTASVVAASGFSIDISGWSSSDYIDLLYYVPPAAVSTPSPSLTFILTDSNLNTWSSSTIRLPSFTTSGWYNASAVMSGANTNSITSFTQLTASFSFGTASIVLDAIRFRDGDPKVTPDIVLLSRTSATTPLISTTYGQPLEIEYILTVT